VSRAKSEYQEDPLSAEPMGGDVQSLGGAQLRGTERPQDEYDAACEEVRRRNAATEAAAMETKSREVNKLLASHQEEETRTTTEWEALREAIAVGNKKIVTAAPWQALWRQK
jgi:hypothetical protein